MFKQDGNTPLNYACRKGNDNITQILLSHGADTTIKNKNGKSPLDECQNEKKNEIKKVFAEYNPKQG